MQTLTCGFVLQNETSNFAMPSEAVCRTDSFSQTRFQPITEGNVGSFAEPSRYTDKPFVQPVQSQSVTSANSFPGSSSSAVTENGSSAAGHVKRKLPELN